MRIVGWVLVFFGLVLFASAFEAGDQLVNCFFGGVLLSAGFVAIVRGSR